MIESKDLILFDKVTLNEVDSVLTWLNNVENKYLIPNKRELDIKLINEYVKKIVDLDGKINYFENYIEAYQYYYVFGYDDNIKIFDEKNFDKRNEINEYYRLFNITGKGKYIIDRFENRNKKDNKNFDWEII